MAGAPHGGAENFFEKLCVSLHEKMNQKVVIRNDFGRYERLRKSGVEPIQLPFGGVFDFKTSKELKKLVEEFKPDIVLTWMNRATSKLPKGDFIHAARLGGYYNLKYYQNCHHLIGNTKDIVKWLGEQGWDQNRSSYISNFTNEHDEGHALEKTDFDTPSDMPVLLCLGRLHENKAFDTAIQALATTPHCHLWIAGTGPEEESLKKMTVELGLKERIRFLGWREDTANLIKTADLFLCPSRHEPLGNVILEAWHHETPIIAAKSQGPCELITHEKNGLLFEIDDVQGCSKNIQKALDDLKAMKKMAAAGKKEYKKSFSEEKIISQYLELFERLCQEKTA